MRPGDMRTAHLDDEAHAIASDRANVDDLPEILRRRHQWSGSAQSKTGGWNRGDDSPISALVFWSNVCNASESCSSALNHGRRSGGSDLAEFASASQPTNVEDPPNATTTSADPHRSTGHWLLARAVARAVHDDMLSGA